MVMNAELSGSRHEHVSRYRRLDEQLIDAYTAPHCDDSLIQRLTEELAATRQLIRYFPPDERSTAVNATTAN